MIAIHYAEAQKRAFPYGKAKIAGPFETAGEAQQAATRLRPLYLDCTVRPAVVHVANKKGAAILGGPKIAEKEAL